MLHLSRGRHAGAGKACGLGLRGPLGGAGFRSALALGLRPGIRREFAGLAWLQLDNPFLQARNHRLTRR